jgi:hypothetical protein
MEYHTLYSGFPPKSVYLNKGIGEGMLWLSLAKYKTSYLPKAITRWKHNLRKQFTNEEYFRVILHTTLFSGDYIQLQYWVNAVTKERG